MISIDLFQIEIKQSELIYLLLFPVAFLIYFFFLSFSLSIIGSGVCLFII